ncbi:cytochrome P450 83B1 [Citrus sinensis]|uniref:Cytochrome P450 83B1 n=1 Tax=Citrus sinensis TaxID=2711 RepID=A0ACB8MUH6_CITSI|nr:cytochrome P450 83B1-like [Citrus sinensis]KAH9740742.1 cytochrome P450 83B1 [Citrus sinensis]KAH9789252.1 cytochrome P450 83B1 [Citrus sinensis]
MALLVLGILFGLPIFLLFLLQKHRKNTSAKFPPGPPGLPIIGNLHQFDATNLAFYLWKLSKQYGPIFSLRLAFRPAIVISSVKLVKEAFKTHDLQFAGRPVLLGLQTLSYNYLGVTFTPHYNEWRDMRKRFVTYLLNSNRIEQFRRVRKDEIFRMVEKISKLGDAADEDGSSKVPINLSEIAMTCVRNIIFRVTFRKRFEDDGPAAVNRLDYLLAETQLLSGTIFFSDCSFSFIGNCLDRITGMHRRLQNHFKDCDRYYQQLIDDHLDPKRPQAARQQGDLIDDLLNLTKAGDLTLDDVKAAIMEIFIGATDTSKVTIEMAMTHLMKNPEAMKKAQEEVTSVAKDKGFVDEDDIPRLEYINAVIKETMRIQPAAQFIPKATTERCVIDGYHIPAETMVLVNVWAIGRDPQVWDKPDKFIPERFVGSNIDMGGQNFEFIPFGSGRRICPGITIALPSVELALANLLYKFDWKMPHGMKIDDLDFEATPGLTQHKKKPLKLVATKSI